MKTINKDISHGGDMYSVTGALIFYNAILLKMSPKGRPKKRVCPYFNV